MFGKVPEVATHQESIIPHIPHQLNSLQISKAVVKIQRLNFPAYLMRGSDILSFLLMMDLLAMNTAGRDRKRRTFRASRAR